MIPKYPQNKSSRPKKECTPLELAEMKTGKYLDLRQLCMTDFLSGRQDRVTEW